MNDFQLTLARHALGLPNEGSVSYRNRYVASLGGKIEASWDDLVFRGMAERGSNRKSTVGFCLTLAGAKAALMSGEKLDREDFPETALTSAQGKSDAST